VPDHYVSEFEAIRRALGADRWFICGQSLGAALTLRYALDRPEAVIAQVFTNSNSALAGSEWAVRVRPIMEAQARRLEAEGRRALDAHPLNPSNGRRLPADVREALAADYELHDPRGVALTGCQTVTNSSVRDREAGNTVPTLMVVGEREKAFQGQALYAERTIAGLDVLRLDAGHAVNAEAAEEFNSGVRGFLAKHLDPL